MKQYTCRCTAYPFPHRESSGACLYKDGQWTGAWWVDVDENPENGGYNRAHEDAMNDPRRGQAQWIREGAV
jgi:hypothetical protein